MHPNRNYHSINELSWKLGTYRLTQDLHWNQGSVEVEVISATPPKRRCRVEISTSAFWSEDHYQKDQEVLLLLECRASRETGTRSVAFIGSEGFCRPFFEGRSIMKAFECIQNMVSLPPEAQFTACSHIRHGINNDMEESCGSLSGLSLLALRNLFDLVEATLLPEQRKACKRWFASTNHNHARKKIEGILSCRPEPLYGGPEITFESIMEVFDEEIEGYEEQKRELAAALANIAQKRMRGVRTLFWGLPGTNKTAFGQAIARAMHRPCMRLDLGGMTSTVSTVGSESTYENSDFGNPFKFISENGAYCVMLYDQIDMLAKAGTERGKDGEVLESLFQTLDPEQPYLRDRYPDGVPVDMSQTIIVVTANRIDNIPSEVISRFDHVIHTEPYSEDLLMKILQRRMPELEEQYGLEPGWIGEDALRESLRYRGDFGARGAIEHLKALAAGCEETITVEHVREHMMRIVDLEDPAVRYHMNEDCYPEKQKKEIQDVYSRRNTKGNLSDQEKRALDMQLDHLTKLIHHKHPKFDADRYDQEVGKLYGLEKAKAKPAAELFAGDVAGKCPQAILFKGAPGVGKTTLAVASAMASGRKLIRIQLNSVTDPDFLKGVGKEKVAAVPGKIVHEAAEAGSVCVALYFDEIDKADPRCLDALLDLFDDSRLFFDNFLGMQIDFSGALLMASCNDADKIPAALRSRFVEIHVPGYSAAEKAVIAKQYILPELTEGTNVTVSEEAVSEILCRHECDAGVRDLKQDIQQVVKQVMLERRNEADGIRVCVQDVERILGAKPYTYTASANPGCVNSLAVAGGMYGMVSPIHVTLLHNGARRITGLAEETIRDCIAVTETWLEEQYGISLDTGFHIHFGPAGVRKDGTSGGVAIAAAMLSAVMGVDISDVAFTGEFDGNRVLPVGGVPLKVQAAQSAGLRAVYLPAANRADIDTAQFPNIEIVFVNTIDEVVARLMPNVTVHPRTAAVLDKHKMAG